MTIPLVLTMVRLVGAWLLAPLLAYLLPTASAVMQWTLAVIFLFLAFTDACDGFFARKYQQVSHLGCVLDPIADKFLVIGCLLALLSIGRIPFWVVFLLLMRELVVMSLRLLAAECKTEIVVSSSARAKTLVHVLLVAWCVCPFGRCEHILCQLVMFLLCVGSVALSWYSAAGYARLCWRVVKGSL